MEIVVCGAGGFIGHHLVSFLKGQGHWVKGVDIKLPEFSDSQADEFIIGDLRDPQLTSNVFDKAYDEVYQLAADMGGAGYIFSGENDADVMTNSCLVNLNVLNSCRDAKIKKIFYSSSACIYPEHNQLDPNNPNCREDTAYPANPDSEYGWEKLFSERMYLSFNRNYGMAVRIARYHNIYGPLGSWNNGKEKAPAAICRKVAEVSAKGGEIEVWGDGSQTRSFLYVDECVKATVALMRSDHIGPYNIGSEEMVSINQLVDIAALVAGKDIVKNHIPGPEGVRGRNSENSLFERDLGFRPHFDLKKGIEKTYLWISEQVKNA